MPTVHTSERDVDDLTILRLYGDLAASPEDTELETFKSVLGALINRGRRDIAINLAGTRLVDAEGLGELVSGLKRARHLGGRMALIAPAERVKKLLAVTKLDTVFKLFASEQEAIERWSREPHRPDRRETPVERQPLNSACI
ncbi:MAG TPA: STAS domain-containing protein [Vicinamibacterales bacterium]|jgi:anti-sigma B factor antagonist